MASVEGMFIILVRIAVCLKILNSDYLQILNLEEMIGGERQICYVTRTFTDLLLFFIGNHPVV